MMFQIMKMFMAHGQLQTCKGTHYYLEISGVEQTNMPERVIHFYVSTQCTCRASVVHDDTGTNA